MERGEVQGERARQLGGRHEARDQRLARGVVEGRGRGLERVQRVERQQLVVAQEGEDREGQRHEGHRGLGREHDEPAVAAVGHDPADQREHDDGHDPGEAHEAQGQRRVGQQVDVPVEGHDLHLRADLGHELGEPEAAEVGMPRAW